MVRLKNRVTELEKEATALEHEHRAGDDDMFLQVCIKRSARGETPLPGVSVSTEMHITRDELEPSKRTASKPQANEVTREWINALVEGIAEVISEEAARRKSLVRGLSIREARCRARSTYPAE